MHDGKRPQMPRGAHRLSNERDRRCRGFRRRCPRRRCRRRCLCCLCRRCFFCRSRRLICGSRRRCYPAGSAGVASVEEACGAGRALPDQEVRLRFQRQIGDQRHTPRRFRRFWGFLRFNGQLSGEVSRCGRVRGGPCRFGGRVRGGRVRGGRGRFGGRVRGGRCWLSRHVHPRFPSAGSHREAANRGPPRRWGDSERLLPAAQAPPHLGVRLRQVCLDAHARLPPP